MKLDLCRPGAPAGDESRKLCGGEDMALKDALGVSGIQVVSFMTLKVDGFDGERVREEKSARLDERLTSEGALRRYGTAPAVGSLANDKALTQARVFWPVS